MKHWFYIVAFMGLGVLVATLIHGLLEIPILSLITGDFERYGESYVWRHWPVLHGVASVLLSLTGAVMGLGLGRRWWHILYVEERYGRPRW